MKNLYFDYNATTPVHPSVVETMTPYWTTKFGNPASASHSFGWDAQAAVDKSRRTISQYFNCKPREVYFTAGATESNNWAIRGVIEHLRLSLPQEPIHILLSSIEHASVKAPIQYLAKLFNFEFDFIPCDNNGTVITSEAKKLLRQHTKLITCIWVNNETGVIQPIAELGALARAHGAYLHTDATQAIGKVKIDLSQLPVDLMSFSGHKIYGPKGVGALYVKQRQPHVGLNAILIGGGQEYGLRSGTLNVPGIAGLGKSFEILASDDFKNKNLEIKKMRDDLQSFIQQILPEAKINGLAAERTCNTLNLSLPKKINQSLSLSLSKIAFSSGSACSSGSNAGSPVLAAMGLSDEETQNAWRISLGYFTEVAEITHLKDILSTAVAKLRSQPLNL